MMPSVNTSKSDITVAGPVQRVMVGTDRSATAERAVRWAASFAERFEADLHIVQVVIPQHPGSTQYGAAEGTRAAGAADDLANYARQIAGERGHAHVVIDDDPAMAIVHAAEAEAIDVLVVGNAGMAGRKEFLLGNVPNRISHNARCTVIIVNTALGRSGRPPVPARPSPTVIRGSLEDEDTFEPRLTARGAHIAAVFAKHGLKELFGRPDKDGAVGTRPAGQAPARGAGGAGAHVLQAGAGALDPSGPAAARVHRRARHAAGPRHAAVRGTGREGHGAGAGRPVGGRVRLDRPQPVGGRHDRRGPPRHARERRPRRREGAAAQRARGDRAGPRAAGAVRRAR